MNSGNYVGRRAVPHPWNWSMGQAQRHRDGVAYHLSQTIIILQELTL